MIEIKLQETTVKISNDTQIFLYQFFLSVKWI